MTAALRRKVCLSIGAVLVTTGVVGPGLAGADVADPDPNWVLTENGDWVDSNVPEVPSQLPQPEVPSGAPTVDPATAPSRLMAAVKPDWAQNVRKLGPSYEGLLQMPVAEWSTGNRDKNLAPIMARADAGEGMPSLVLYNIPGRDDGSHSAGGTSDKQAYARWIDGVVRALGDRPAVVVLEPDALAQAISWDKNSAKYADRIEMLAGALTALSKTKASVYLDAGHPAWPGVDQIAAGLRDVQARGAVIPGLSVNVSNFKSTADSEKYGEAVSKKVGLETKVLVDVSRNRVDTGKEWCNPKGQRLGEVPDMVFDTAAKFEHIFVKTPGESDGNCGIAPSVQAGGFSSELLKAQVTG